MSKIKKVCNYCGSEDVTQDANTKWSVEKQQWEISDMIPSDYCNNCEGETNIQDEKINLFTKEQEEFLCKTLDNYVEYKKNKGIPVPVKILKVTTSLNILLQEKNKRYGNSALEPLEGIKYTAEDGIKIRLADKLKRIINSEELRINDIADVMGYLVLLCVDKNWLDFNELID
jgi:hypothetical protein